MRKLRLRNTEQHSENYSAGEDQKLDLNSSNLHSGFPGSSAGKESFCNAGDPSLIPGSGRSPGEERGCLLQYSRASLVAQMVKDSPAIWETWVGSLGLEDPWRREWLLTPVFWPGEPPWTEKPGGLQSMVSQLDMTERLSTGHSTIYVQSLS